MMSGPTSKEFRAMSIADARKTHFCTHCSQVLSYSGSWFSPHAGQLSSHWNLSVLKGRSAPYFQNVKCTAILLKYLLILCSNEDKSRRLSTCREYALLQVLIAACLFTSSMRISCISSRNSSVSLRFWIHVCCISACCISSLEVLDSLLRNDLKLAELTKLPQTSQVPSLSRIIISLPFGCPRSKVHVYLCITVLHCSINTTTA